MESPEVIVGRLLLAVLAGALIGAEREYYTKDAGFRTLILISLGSAVFTLCSFLLAKDDTSRIAANIVTGIGFLGAGVIFKTDNRIKGITTAATVWITAALGMCAGAGYIFICMAGIILTLVVLFLFTFLEEWIERINQQREYQITCHYKEGVLTSLEEDLKRHHLKFKAEKKKRNQNTVTGIWIVKGAEKNHNKFIEEILLKEDVLEFDF